ncbi:carboxypeptidase M32 [Candidatus Acetothermia bacterium]|nr:carboxypeptidase M32 [Candidatus Acetothermia bacterium]MBI3643252.1 carboxypeptidase M32 [Candidatus Acetothermia bacterium]
MGQKLAALKERLGTISDINSSLAMISWDQETYMPPGAAKFRGYQLATLGRLSHELFTADETGTLLDAAAKEVKGLDYDSDDASLIRIVKRDYELARKLPSSLVAEFAQVTTAAKEAWKEAYHTSKFSTFQPHLEKVLALTIKKAEAYGYKDHIYDPLLDEYEPGMKTAHVSKIFSDLKPHLVSLVEQISERAPSDDSCIHLDFDEQAQLKFGNETIAEFGFDFKRGRQDLSHHPFCSGFTSDDVRLTTRVERDFLSPCLFGLFHECGHGLYEQGVRENLARTLLADGTSLGVHESQSRMWENIVGRSRGFWKFCYPKIQKAFPAQLKSLPMETFYRAINRVKPSLIRVEADEVTYNLHIMLRFELETQMVSGKIAVKDLPKLWNAKVEEYLGIKPSNDTEGVLQDIHWSMGGIGYFSTYALGNLMSAQLYERAQKDISGLGKQIESGKFDGLLSWLRKKIHVHGRKFTANELLERVTGEPLQSRSYLNYIKTKFSDIYGELD